MKNKLKAPWGTVIFYCVYTLLFLGIQWGCFKYFHENGRLVINHADAWRQHLKAVAYYSKWLRGVFYNIFVLHNFSIQTFSFGMGYGSDIYTTLQYYAIGDILNLPAALVKTEHIYIYFQVITLLRPYLAGITFSLFAKYVKKDAGAISLLGGMFIYAFGSYFLFLGIWHPFFANPMIYLPLVLLGAERILKEKKTGTFAIAVFLAASNNFYFFFAIALLTVIYVLVRLFGIYGKDIKSIFSVVSKFITSGVTGLLMSMVVLLPVLFALPNNPRSDSGISVPFLYGKEYYKELVRNLISFVYHGEADVQLGFSGVLLLALSVMLARFIVSGTAKKRTEFIIFLLITLFLSVPFFGYLFAGFSYVINRWCFAAAFFAGFLVTCVMDEILELSIRELVISGIICVLYGALSFFTGAADSEALRIQLIIAFAAFVITALFAIAGSRMQKEKASKLIPVSSTVIFVLVAAGILINAYEAFSPDKGNMISDYMEKTTTEDMYMQLQSTETQVVEEAAAQDGLDVSGDFYRYSGRNLVWNSSLLDGISSTQFLWSLTDKNVSEYFTEIANNDEQNFAYFGLDDRAIPNCLAGVNYFSLRFNTPEERAFVPSGYAEVYGKYNFAIFKNTAALPLGYTSSCVMSRTEFEKLSHIERQEALLYGTVLEDSDAEKTKTAYELSDAQPILTSKEISCELVPGEGVSVEDGLISAKAGSEITLKFDGEAGGETYLYFGNLHIDTAADTLSIVAKTSLADGTEIQKSLNYKTEKSQYYSGWHDFLINMGASADAKNYITVVFTEDGEYRFDDLKVYFQPLDNLGRQLQVYKTNTLQNVNLYKNPISFATDKITGTIDLEQDKLLCLGIPYLKGFTAYVDGEKTEILKSNVMFMSIPLTAGSHEIEIRYSTPGLFAGFILSILGVLIFVFCAVRKKND